VFGSSDAAKRWKTVNEKEFRASSVINALSPAAPPESFQLARAPGPGHLDPDGVLCSAQMRAFVAANTQVANELQDATSRKAATRTKYCSMVGLFQRFLTLNNFGEWFGESKSGSGDWHPLRRASDGTLLVVPPALITFYLLACGTGGYTTTMDGVTRMTGASARCRRARARSDARRLTDGPASAQPGRTAMPCTAAGLA
jgi:hypothetical protein